jgi:hypothetical protein
VTQKNQVVGHFNAHMRACSILYCNESFFAGDRQHESSLKGMITDEDFMIEAKGIDAVKARNRMGIMVSSNEAWAVPANPDARRFSVFDCGDAQKVNTKYFGALQKQLDSGGYAALLFHLLHEVDLSGFDEHTIIKTAAMANEQIENLKGVDNIWFQCLWEGELPGGTDGNHIRGERLLTWAKLQGLLKWDKANIQKLGYLFGDPPCTVRRGMGFKKRDKPRPRSWAVLTLREARQRWDERMFPIDWPELQPFQLDLGRKGATDPDDWCYVDVGDEPKEREQYIPSGDYPL